MNIYLLALKPLQVIFSFIKRLRTRSALKHLSYKTNKRIIVGACDTRFSDWVSTDKDNLDLLKESNWAKYFQPNSITAILAEHVWEHLVVEDAILAATICYKFLKPGGYLRVAVPDGCHPDPKYVEAVRPGGSGVGALDHKVLYNYVSLCDVLVSAGFQVRLYEYFDELGQFHFADWDPADGMIERSKRYDERNVDGSLCYTSIVLDAFKL